MILIVGLGNPGLKYKKTRHNIGFRVLDQFRKENNFPRFRLDKKFNALVSEKRIAGKKILLAKPQTLMNNSGKAVKSIISDIQNSRKTIAIAMVLREFENLWVVHDDIDLPLGKIKIVKNRGSAGHKGVESIIKELGTKDFFRIRIGIMNYELRIMKAENFVLQKFTRDEERIVKQVLTRLTRFNLQTLKEFANSL